jgi:hypothetical protein
MWEDRCNRPDNVDSHPDALIHKASIAIQIQTSGRQLLWSRRACIKYGNYVHQINHPDDHPPDPDVRSLFMEITCSERATVQMTGHHRPEAALKQERFSAKFFRISVAQLSVQTAYDHRPDSTQFYQARCSFELSAYKLRPLGLRIARIRYLILLVLRELYCEIIELS